MHGSALHVTSLESLKKYATPLLRIALALVFLWFGINQFMDAKTWIGYLPPFLQAMANPGLFIYANATMEIVLGALLLLGFLVRFCALILGLHLFGIFAAIGYNEIAVRDFGLACATLSIFLSGDDDWCLGRRFKKVENIKKVENK